MSMRELQGRLVPGSTSTPLVLFGALSDNAARLLVGGVIAVAVTLSLVWTVLVPIYQAPDEPNHLDYAFSILTAGHLISARDAPVSQYVHPYTQVLLRTTDTGAIAFHMSVPAPLQYGSPAYFDHLMRTVAGDLHGYRPREPKATPLLITVYPFGYYALLAAWLGLVQIFWGNPVQLFFAARFLSVVLLGLSLVLTYASLRRCRLDAWRSVLLVAAMGIFPLTSFVSSYVQPDNLALFLVSLSIYLGLKLRDARTVPDRYRLAALLGLSLGALVVTKYQFYICTGAALAAMLLSYREWRDVPRPRTVLPVLFFLPALMLTGVQVWVSHGADLRYTHRPGVPHMSYADIESALASGAGAFLSYAWAALGRAFQDYYTGATFHSFWGDFGWLDTPLMIVSPSVEQWVLLLIQDMTLALFVLVVLRMGQVFFRAARTARHRPRVGLRLLAANPLINAYLLFTLFMYALYVVSDDSFGAQGRDWFPLLGASFLIGTVYGPAALGGRAGRVVSGLVIGATMLYGVVGSAYALQDLHARYYGPRERSGWTQASPPLRLPRLGQAVAHIDDVFPGLNAVEVSGWAIDARAARPARAVYISLDGRRVYRAAYGSDRPDVAQVYGSNGYEASGFWIEIPTAGLKPGQHSLTVDVVGALHGYYALSPPSYFVIPR